MKLIKLSVFLFLMILSTNGYAAKWIGEASISSGGDELVAVTTTTDYTEKLKGGKGLSLSTGAQINFSETLIMNTLIGYKFDSVDAVNGSFDWNRYPLDLLFFYHTEQWNFGGGLTYHLNPEFSGSVTIGPTTSSYDVKFKDALGYVFAVDFMLGNQFYIGARYTLIDYVPDNAALKELNGDSIGVAMGFIFGK